MVKEEYIATDKLFIQTQLWLLLTFLATPVKKLKTLWQLLLLILPLCAPVGFIYIINDGQSTLIDVLVNTATSELF